MYGVQKGDHNTQYNSFNVAASAYEDGLERLQVKAAQVAEEQVAALTGLGVLSVPWEHGAEPGLADEGDLARFVAEGGRLVVLGASQSGKTTLASRLVELISAHTDRQVALFPLVTWDVVRTSLGDWLVAHLRTRLLQGRDDGDVADRSLAEGRVIPVFDGFDEIDEGFRERAAGAINDYTARRPAVLTSIPQSAGVPPASALYRPAVITLTSVSPAEVGRYLVEDAPEATVEGWRLVAARITAVPDSPAATALSTPLMAWLAKRIYSMPPKDPTDLVDLQRFATAERVEEHLLGGLVDAVFARQDTHPPDGSPATTFTPADARRWLRFLATRADRNVVAFWEIQRYTPMRRAALMAAVLTGLLFAGLVRVVASAAAPAFFLVLAGLFFAFGFARGYSSGRRSGGEDPRRPGYVIFVPTARGDMQRSGPTDGSLVGHVRALTSGVLLAALAYLIAMLFGAGWLWGQPTTSLVAGLLLAAGAAPLIGFLGGRIAAWKLRHDPALDAGTGARAGDPLLAITNDRRSGLGMMKLVSALLTVGYLLYWAIWLPRIALVGGLALPIAVAVTLLYWNTWTQYKFALLWLSARGHLPWRLPEFLSACHSGGLLRRSGNYFEFRHRRLRTQLALEAAP